MKRCALRRGLVSGPGLRSLNAARRRGEERWQVEEKIPERETSIRTAGERLQRRRRPSSASPSSPISTGFAPSGLDSASVFSLHSFKLLSDSCTCGPAPVHYYICTCFQSLRTALASCWETHWKAPPVSQTFLFHFLHTSSVCVSQVFIFELLRCFFFSPLGYICSVFVVNRGTMRTCPC